MSWCPGASSFVVTLYGSLAATGKGHLTDVALKEALTGGSDTGIEIVWKPKEFLPQHPNGMNFKAYNAHGEMLCEKTYFSVGGGDISETGRRDVHMWAAAISARPAGGMRIRMSIRSAR